MIASVDGGTSWRGVSGSLGGPADKKLFGVIRSLADVVLVGAGTMREEHYGPSSVPIAVVTRSASLDWQSPFFTEAEARPIVLTVEDAPEENLEHAAEVADVVFAGRGGVDLRIAVDELGSRGFRRLLAEGGPTLNSQLARAGVLDELCLTVSPMLLAGDAKRILAGAELSEPVGLQLRSVLEDESYLFLRYRCLGS
jgi:riboflavin biosynthesis pyrimidine reductase